MAEITVDVGVRLNVLQSSITELERSLKNLKPDEAGFKGLQKIISSMRAEMEKLQIQTGKSFSSPQQFRQAGKTVEKLETSLARARLAVENIKFSDLKLDSNQQKAFEQVEHQIEAAESKFNDFQEKIKSGIIGNSAIQDGLQLIKTSDLQKSFDELDKIIDKSVTTNTDRLAGLREELARIKEQEAKNIASRNILKEGVNKKTFADYDKYFNDYTRKYTDKNGQEFTKNFTRYKSGFSGENNQKVLEAIADSIGLSDSARQKFFTDLKGKSLEDINKFISSISSSDLTKAFKQNDLSAQSTQKSQEIGLLVEQLNQLKIAQAAFKDAQGDNGSLAPAMEQYNKVLEQCEQTLARLRGEAIQTFQDKAGLNSGNFDVMAGEVQNFTNQLNKANTAFLKLQSQQQTFNSMKMAIVNFMGFNQVLNLTKRAVSDAMNHIKQLDATMNGISIVTDMTTGDLWKQVDSYSAMAQKYGATIQGAYDVSKIYYQQGLDTVDVLKLTDETLKLSRISGLDYATTTDYMTTALRGFKMEMQDASVITDVYSALASSTAVSQQELAEAMTRTASSMESVGSTFQDTSAMIATMVAVTRESANNIGSAMKSIASRYGELTKDPAKLLDSEGEAMSFNKVDEALRSVGISMQTTDHQFRDFTDVIVELSEKWNTLDSVQQRYIATQFAGNRQQSRFLALVSNGDLLKENMETAANSEDTGTLQALKALDSIESKINQVQVAAQQFYTTIGAEGVWKGALDGIKSYIDGLNGLPKIFDKIPLGAVAVLINAINLIKTLSLNALSGIASNLKTNLTLAGTESGKGFAQSLLNEIKAIIEPARNTGVEIGNAINSGITQQQKNQIGTFLDTSDINKIASNSPILPITFQNDFQNRLNQIQQITGSFSSETQQKFNELKNSITDLSSFNAAIAQVKGMLLGVGETAENQVPRIKKLWDSLSNRNSTISHTILSIAQAFTTLGMMIDKSTLSGQRWSGTMTGIGGALQTTLGIIQKDPTAIVMGITNIVNGISLAYESQQEKLERLNKEAEQANNEYLQKKSNLKQLNNQIEKYKELEKAQYDSAEARQAFLDASNALAETSPTLIAGFDAEGNAIIELTNNYELLAGARLEAAEAGLKTAQKGVNSALQQSIVLNENILKNGRKVKINNQNDVESAAVDAILSGNAVSDRISQLGIIENRDQFVNFREMIATIASNSTDLFTSDVLSDYIEFNNALDILGEDLKSGFTKFTPEFNKYSGFTELVNEYLEQSAIGLDKTFSQFIEERYGDSLKNIKLPEELQSTEGQYIVSLKGIEQATQDNNIEKLFEYSKQAINEYNKITNDLRENKEHALKNNGVDSSEYKAAVEEYNNWINQEEKNQEYIHNIADNYSEYRAGLNAISVKQKNLLATNVYSDYIKEINDLNSTDSDVWDYYESSTQGVELLNKALWKEFNNNKDTLYNDNIDDFIASSQYESIINAFNESYGNFWNNASDSTRQDVENFFNNLGNYTYEQATDYLKKVGFEDTAAVLSEDIYNESNVTERVTNALKARSENGNQVSASMVGQLWRLEQIPAALEDQFKTIADKVDGYSRDKLFQQAYNLGDAYINVVEQIQEDAGDNTVAIYNLLKDVDFTTKGINELKNKLKEEFQLADDSDIIAALDNLSGALIENIAARIDAVSTGISDNIKDTKANLEKMGSGLEFDEASKIYSQLKTTNANLNFTDVFNFDQNTGKYLVTEAQYIKDYYDYANKELIEENNATQAQINQAKALLNDNDQKFNSEQIIADNSDIRKMGIALGLKNEIDAIDEAKNIGDTSALNQAVADFNEAWKNAILVLSGRVQANAQAIEDNAGYSERQGYLADAQYKEYIKSLTGQENASVENFVRERNFSIDGSQAIIEQVNSVYDNLINDVLSNGFENINLDDAKWKNLIKSDEAEKSLINYIQKGDYTDFVQEYASLAGKSIEETNDLMVQALEKETQSTIGAEDALKNVNFIKEDLAYASLDTLQNLANNLEIAVEDLFYADSYNAALQGYKVNMATLAANGLENIKNQSNIILDSINSFLDSIIDAFGKGLEGKLTSADLTTLNTQLDQLGIQQLSEADFTKTEKGLKMSADAAIKVYSALKEVDSIKARLAFDDLYKSLTASTPELSNISSTMATIARTEKEIADNEKEIAELREKGGNENRISQIEAENSQLREQLDLYEQIKREQSSDASSFDFMGRKLPELMQGPENYWNSVGKAYKAINTAGKSGYMEIQDYYNIINEMANLVQMSNGTFEWMGMNSENAMQRAAELIQAGMGALKNVDGEGVKVALGDIALDMQVGAENMSAGIDTGVKEMARGQIAMLDAAINMLEAIVAMQELGNIDTNGKNGIEFGELFSFDEENKVWEYNKNVQPVIDNILKAAEKNEDLKTAFNSFYLGGYSLYELMKNDADELTKIGSEGRQALLQAFNIINDLATSDDWDIENIDKIYQKLEESGLQDIFSQHVYNEKTGMSLLITPELRAEIDWSKITPEQLENAGFTGDKAAEEARKFLDNYARGQGEKGSEITVEDTRKVKILSGDVKVTTTGEGKDKKTTYEYNGKTGLTEDQLASILQTESDVGGKFVDLGKNGEIILESTIGERKITKVVTEKGTKYEFDDGFSCIAENDSDAVHQYYVAKQIEKYGDNQDNWENEKTFTYKEKLNIVRNSDIKFVDGSTDGGNGSTSKEQAEEIRRHTTEEINEKLAGATQNTDGTVTFNLGDVPITIEGEKEALQGKGEEIAQAAADSLGIDTALSKTITDAIQQAFQGDAGSKIGTAISEGIKTAFGANTEVGADGIPIDNINVKPTKITIDAASSQKELKLGEDNTSIPIPAITVGPAGITINTGTIPPTLDKTDFTITGITVTGEQVPVTINSTGVVTPYTEPVIVPMLSASGTPLLFTVNPDGSIKTVEPGTVISGLTGFDAEGNAGTITVTVNSSTVGEISENSTEPNVGSIDATATAANVEAQSYTVTFTSKDGKATNIVKVPGLAQLQGVLASYGTGFIDGTSNISGELLLTVPTPDVDVTTNAANQSLEAFRQKQESNPLNLTYKLSPQNGIEGLNGTNLSNSRANATTIARNWEGSNKKKGDKKSAIKDIKDNEDAIVDYVQQVQMAVNAGESLSDIDYNNILSLKEILGDNTSGGFLDQFSTTADKILSLSDANKSDSLTGLKELAQSFSGLEVGELPQVATALGNIASAAERLKGIPWDIIADGIKKVSAANSGTGEPATNSVSGGNTGGVGGLQSVQLDVKAEKVDAAGASIAAQGGSVTIEGTPTISTNAAVNVTGSSVTITGVSQNNDNPQPKPKNNTGDSSTQPQAQPQSVGVNLDISEFTNSISTAQSAISSLDASNAETAASKFNTAMTNTMNSVPNSKTVDIKINTPEKINVTATVGVTVNVSGGTKTGDLVTGRGAPNTPAKVLEVSANAKVKGNTALSKGRGTLMGELGRELVVSGGKYYTVGDNGAEFVDLPDDAIVFNHQQTKRLLGSKRATGGSRGKPVKSEAAALSFATGNVSGPALASAAAALAALKQIRAMWQSMLDASAKDLGSQAGRGGGGGGGGGGGDDAEQPTTTTDDIQRWYNWLRQIDKIEQDISYQEKLQTKYENDRIANGQKIYKAQKQQYDLLGEEIKRNEKLAALQKSWYDNKRAELAASSYGKIFTYDENGLQQYTGNDRPGSGVGLDILENLTRRNVNGQAIDNAATAKKQLAYLQSVGFNLSDLLYNDDGTKVAKSIDKNLKLKKINKKDKDNDLYTQMMENFWNNVDSWRDELDSLYDSYHEQQEKIIENQNKQNEILQAFVENELDVEQQLLEAIESREQALIDKLQDQKEALEKSNDKFIKGLTDQLNKEKEMRQNNERDSDLVKLQRQLAILQRSGGSASQIKSLQDQIASQQQDMYYEERQQQIDAIQEASDKQLERLDTQISIMTETLDYQKENGLLWNEVREIMETHTPEEAAQKILEWNSDYASKSALDVQESIREFQEAFQQWTERRDDENDPLQDTSISRSDAIEDIEAGNKEFSALSGESKSKIQSAARNAGQKAYDEAIANGGTEEEAEKAYRQAYSNTISDADTLQKYKNIESHGADAEEAYNDFVTDAKKQQSFINTSLYKQNESDIKEKFIEKFVNEAQYDDEGNVINRTEASRSAMAAALNDISADNQLTDEDKIVALTSSVQSYKTPSKTKKLQKSMVYAAGSEIKFKDGKPTSYKYKNNKGKVVSANFLQTTDGNWVLASLFPEVVDAYNRNSMVTAAANYINDAALSNFNADAHENETVEVASLYSSIGGTQYGVVEENGKITNRAIGRGPISISGVKGYVPKETSINETKTPRFASIQVNAIDGKLINGGPISFTPQNLGWKKGIKASQLKKTNYWAVINALKNKNDLARILAYKQGGMADFTGPAWLDGTKTKPEAVLNAAQTDFLKHDLLGNKRNSLASIVTQLQDIFDNTIAGTTSSTSSDESITIENVSINFNAGTISSDYDARRAGELVKEEMLKIARKTGNRSVSRR